MGACWKGAPAHASKRPIRVQTHVLAFHDGLLDAGQDAVRNPTVKRYRLLARLGRSTPRGRTTVCLALAYMRALCLVQPIGARPMGCTGTYTGVQSFLLLRSVRHEQACLLAVPSVTRSTHVHPAGA
jgi:hypothetical protein